MVQLEPSETQVECKFCGAMVSSGAVAQQNQPARPSPVAPSLATGNAARSRAIGLGAFALLLSAMWFFFEFFVHNPAIIDAWIDLWLDVVLAVVIILVALGGLAAANKARKHHRPAGGAMALSLIVLGLGIVFVLIGFGHVLFPD